MGKQETFSVSEIRRLCAASEYLDESDIHEGDKTVSFDGNIIYYQNKKPKAVGSEIFIPVQIKGKEYKKLPTKNMISYSVSLRDLNNYFKNGGVIFFVVAIEKETNLLKTYAKILLPIDIQQIKTGKEEQDDISINLALIHTPFDLETICDLFAKNRLKQSLVILGAPVPDFSTIRELSVSLVNNRYVDPAIAIAKSSIKYVYAKQYGIEIAVSATNFMTSKESHFHIVAGDYIHVFPVKHIYSLHNTVTTINDIIKINFDEKNKKVHFSLLDYSNTDFDKIYEIAKFLLAVSKSEDIIVNGVSVFADMINPIKKKMSKGFIKHINHVIKLGELLDCLNIPIKAFTIKEVGESEKILLILKEALINHKPVSLNVENDCGVYYQKIGSKKIVLEYVKDENGLFSVCNYLEDGKRIMIFDGNAEEPQPLSKWFSILPENIADTIFDQNQMLEDLSESENKSDFEYLTFFILALINEYDSTKQKKFLDFATELQNIIEKKLPDTEANIINRMQINYRKGALAPEQKRELEELKAKSCNLLAICCACLLLKQYNEFEIHFKELDLEEQEALKEWPIYNLVTTK